MTEKKMV